MRVTRILTFVVVLAALAAAAPAQQRWVLYRLEPLETPAGVLDQVRAADMNNRGRVVGRVHNGARGAAFRSAAFVFAPGTGMHDLDPDGTYLSRADAVNDAGVVFGRSGSRSRYSQSGLFLYRPGEGYDFLGTNRQIHQTFRFEDMNLDGEVVGSVQPQRRRKGVPYLYSPAEGWINLLPVDPRLGGTAADPEYASAEHVNDHGEIVFRSGQKSYVSLRDGSFEELTGDFLEILLQPVHRRSFSNTGQVVTIVGGERQPLHAQLFRPGRGTIDVHPRGFKASAAEWISKRGMVGGTLREGTVRDTVFTYDERREPKLRVEITADDFRAVFGEISRVVVFDMNDNGDFIGFVSHRPEDWFYYNRTTGLLRIQSLIEQAGGEDYALLAAQQLNNRGQILLLARPKSCCEGLHQFKFDLSKRRMTQTFVLGPRVGYDG